MEIPKRTYWPNGFLTDFVTGFPDAPYLWAGCWYKPWTWFDWKKVDLRRAAWWHDCRYFLGWCVSTRVSGKQLSRMRPLPNSRRSEIVRAIIDEQLERDFVKSGMHSGTARIAGDVIVEWAGKDHYWWATDKELRRRGLES